MITVIIAGGSGTRLWPLSTSHNPKQLLKLTNDYTMVQNTYNRATTFSKEIYVVPDISHSDRLREQLPVLDDDHCIVEPGRRGTANCIITALVQIAKTHDHDEPIAFISADHNVRDIEGFARSFRQAEQCSRNTSEIVLIGIEPTYPATGFGYIERADELEMKENASDLYDTYQKLSQVSDMTSSDYSETYLNLENKVVDIALIEKVTSLAVVPAGFDWMDVGNFNDLHAVNEHDENENHISGKNIHHLEVENAYIRNEEDKPIAVIGLDNIVVVNSKDGILVSRKDVSPKVGDIAKKIQD